MAGVPQLGHPIEIVVLIGWPCFRLPALVGMAYALVRGSSSRILTGSPDEARTAL
jgi:hypothetical protein